MKIKKIILTLVICIIPFFTSGCIKIDTEITIDKNGQVFITDKVLIDKKLEALSGESIDDINFKKVGFYNQNTEVQAESIDEGDYRGRKFISNFKNIKNILLLAKYFNPNILNKGSYKYVKTNKSIYNTNYLLNFNANFRDLKDKNGEKMFPSDIAEFVSTKLTINIPTKAKQSNASDITRNGLTHIWNFNPKNNYNVILEFSVINYINIILSVIGLLFLIIGYIFMRFDFSKIAQKCLFYISTMLFVYFTFTQFVYLVQDLESNFTFFGLGIIIIFTLLTIITIFFLTKTMTENNEIIDNDVKECPYCGEEININAKKCWHCGEWLENNQENQKITYCPYCGEEINVNAKKCKNCGEWLTDYP